MKIYNQIIERVCKQTGATPEEVERVYKFMFKYIVQMIRRGKNEGIKILFFGKFFVNPKVLEYQQKAKIKKAFDEFPR